VILIYFLGSEQRLNGNEADYYFIHMWIGLRFDLSNLLKSIFCSLFLTMVLFAGPIVQNFMNRNIKYALSSENKLDTLTDLTVWRNYIISPFTEEFVFRSCMIPLLIPHLGFVKTVLITPLFFGMAHLHHIIEGYCLNQQSFKMLCIQHLFQFTYTYIFGAYSSYLFIRTGSFFSSFFSHAFCNLMGFPNFHEMYYEFGGLHRIVLLVSYVIGLISFFCIISTVTRPTFFDNHLFSKYN
jgi:prenyl protein peptidase